MLRPALELAIAVARRGQRETPPVPPPGPLRPLLSFARLPARALETARKVLDEDEDFRARVAESADEELLGRPAWLFLTRPPDWEEELDSYASAAASVASAEADDQAERSAARRLRGAEEAARRAGAERDAVRDELARVAQDLAGERRSRREAEDELARLAELLASTEAERDTALQEAQKAAVEARTAKAQARAAQGEARETQGEVNRREVQLARLRAELAASRRLEGAVPAGTAGGEGDRPGGPGGRPTASDSGGGAPRSHGDLGPGGEAQPPASSRHAGSDPRGLPSIGPGPGAEPPPGSLEEVARSLRQASEAASNLGAALAAASQALPGATAEMERRAPSGAPEPASSGNRPPAAGPGGESRLSAAPTGEEQRLPLLLPPAVLDDSPEAAQFLLRAPRAVVLVDGYNASLATWPGLTIAEQRERLVDALSELSARTGAAVHVVFDGVDQEAASRPRPGRNAVRLSFSPGHVEADDIILDLVEQTPASRPVVVASNDRRVQREARRRGANVISVAQLLAVLRRER